MNKERSVIEMWTTESKRLSLTFFEISPNDLSTQLLRLTHWLFALIIVAICVSLSNFQQVSLLIGNTEHDLSKSITESKAQEFHQYISPTGPRPTRKLPVAAGSIHPWLGVEHDGGNGEGKDIPESAYVRGTLRKCDIFRWRHSCSKCQLKHHLSYSKR